MFLIEFFKWLFNLNKKTKIDPRQMRRDQKKAEKEALKGRVFYRSFESDAEANEKEDITVSKWKIGKRKTGSRFAFLWPWKIFHYTEKKKPRNWTWLKRIWAAGSTLKSGAKHYFVARDGSLRLKNRPMSQRDRHRFEVACRKNKNQPGTLQGHPKNIRSEEEITDLYLKMV